MACLRRRFICQMIALLVLPWAAPAFAQEAAEAGPAGLYARPTLVLDPGMHTAVIEPADVDAAGRYAVTGSEDKTVRVWSVADGRLERTIRLPAGPGYVGKVYAVAISPDGELIAAGGWTRWTEGDPQEQIYLFNRATGELAGRIDGLPEIVLHLTFSPDGRYLAATLGSANGLRVYARESGWGEGARDAEYRDTSYWAAFSAEGRLATTSNDGHVRLYDRNFELVAKVETVGGQRPYGLAFSPNGTKLAVGYHDSTAVDIFDGHALAPLPGPDTNGIDNNSLLTVAWSADGETLFAGGTYNRDRIHPVLAWAEAGSGARAELPASRQTIFTLAPLANGGLLVAAGDPYFAILDSDGSERSAQRPPQANFEDQDDVLAVSADGQMVDFGYERLGRTPARFNLATLDLTRDPPADGSTRPPEHEGLLVAGWKDTASPTLDGAPLGLQSYELSHSLAIHPNGTRFVLGTEWWLRAYDARGELLWRQGAPAVVWAVNIAGDGRLVVAAYADGTIRWHRMDDGRELLTFFPLADRKNWVAWTPEGAYTATQGARNLLRWHVNRGWDSAAEAIPVSDIPEQHRPEVLPLVLQELDFVTALGIVEQREMWSAIQRRTNSAVPPGAQLHVLAIGVGDYNQQAAKHLRLEFADDDAWDVASALLNTQGSVYAKVNPQVLRNGEATRAGIFRALDTIQKTMQQDDVAVLHFSGHGALVDGKLYLLTHEVDAHDSVGIKSSAMAIDALRAELLRLAQRGRVLVLLDACRSGAASADGASITLDATQLRTALAAANVTVLTSSSGKENSIEHEKWQNGAFTQVFLDALGQDADSDRNSVVSMTELTRYVTAGVPRLVREVDPERQQTPGVEMRFEHTIFAAGL